MSKQKHSMFDLSIIGIVGVPARYGGFETLAEQLIIGLAEEYKVQVFCTRKRNFRGPDHYRGASLSYINLDANGWQSIPYDIVSMFRAALNSKCILILGVSGCIFLPVLRLLFPRTYIITNIDGIEWKREKWGGVARIVLRFSEKIAVKFSNRIIADNQGIVDYVKLKYSKVPNLIPYGGDQFIKCNASKVLEKKYFIAICRIEPENNVDKILEAFKNSKRRLKFLGNWYSSEYGRKLKSFYKNLANVELLDPEYDEQQLRLLREGAICYVHGHSAGGTNPSLVEAMANSMAVCAYDVSYNRYTTFEGAFYWKNSSDLVSLIENIRSIQFDECAKKMKLIAEQNYTWEIVINSYKNILFNLGDR